MCLMIGRHGNRDRWRVKMEWREQERPGRREISQVWKHKTDFFHSVICFHTWLISVSCLLGSRTKPQTEGKMIILDHAYPHCEKYNVVLWLKPKVGVKCGKQMIKEHTGLHRSCVFMWSLTWIGSWEET